jgi:hypothetical protein
MDRPADARPTARGDRRCRLHLVLNVCPVSTGQHAALVRINRQATSTDGLSRSAKGALPPVAVYPPTNCKAVRLRLRYSIIDKRQHSRYSRHNAAPTTHRPGTQHCSIER